MRKVWWLMALSGIVAATAWGNPVPELSTAYVDLTFDDGAGTQGLPATMRVGVNDRLSKKWLYGPVGVTPVANCPTPGPGCTTVTIPNTANAIVGRCATQQVRYCLTDNDCPDTGRPCRADQEGTQDHVLTVEWTYTGGAGSGRIPYQVLNLEFLPFPDTQTPTFTKTATPTATPTVTQTVTRTATATRTP